MAGISTITVTSIPDLTASAGAPRIIAVERPLGYLFGMPGDLAGLRQFLITALKELEKMRVPGSEKHISEEWITRDDLEKIDPPSPPPILEHLKRNPLQIRSLFNRQVPEEYRMNNQSGLT